MPVAKRRSFAVSTGFRKDPRGPTRGDQPGDHRGVVGGGASEACGHAPPAELRPKVGDGMKG